MANKFFKAVASAFVVEEEGKQETSTIAVPQSTVVQTVQQPTVQQPTGQLNQVLLDKLCERLDQENIPGPDYMELKQAVNDVNMTSIIPDESMRFLAAFTSLKAGAPQLTKSHVVESINHYISCLTNWEKDALADIEKVRDTVTDKKKEIDSITEQIAQLTAKIGTLKKDVDETEGKCAKNEADMKMAVSFLVGKLNEDKEKIEKNLKD